MVFKKPFRELKTSAPLRSSDRRKLRSRVQTQYNDIQLDEVVPEGIQIARFVSNSGEQGALYTSDGEPLWFSLGRSGDPEAEDILPTIYTLSKNPHMLPILRTPDAVLPILMGGADLMAPGVHTSRSVLDPLVAGAIVSIRNVAVGRMVLAGVEVYPGRKGKAVRVLHVLGDALWEMGSKTQPVIVDEDDNSTHTAAADNVSQLDALTIENDESAASQPYPEQTATHAESPDLPTLSPKEVDELLRISLLQAIRSVPRAALPMSTSSFYSSHILPSRPDRPPMGVPVDIKHSSYKSLGAFLKVAEKDGLLKLKGESITMTNAGHPDISSLKPFRTVGEAEARAKRRDAAERAKEEQVRPLEIIELWKPHGPSIPLFGDAGADTTTLYSAVELRTTFSAYITTNRLQNAHEPQYINVLEGSSLYAALDAKKDPVGEHCRRDDAIRRLQDNMQAWYSIEGVIKKGTLKPINVTSKFRQGKRPVTLMTNFEIYGLDADWLGEELRRICAGATSVAPLPGKTSGKEVLVQGKQNKTVLEFLIAHGIPKKWIETVDLTEKK